MSTDLELAMPARSSVGFGRIPRPGAGVGMAHTSGEAAEGIGTLNGIAALLLGVYLLLCSGFALVVMVHLWSGSQEFFRYLCAGIELEPGQLADVQNFGYTAGGAVLGAIILALRNLHRYAVSLRRFRWSYGGSYLLGPWAAGLLGVTTYAMLRGGLLAFGSEADGAETAYLALGILTGFSWERMLARIDDAARQVFGSRSYRDRDVGPGARPQAAR